MNLTTAELHEAAGWGLLTFFVISGFFGLGIYLTVYYDPRDAGPGDGDPPDEFP